MADFRVGIDLGGTKIHGVLLAPDGTFRRELRIATPANDYPGTLRAVAGLVDELDTRQRFKVGIGTPGSVLPDTQRMHNCNSTWLNGQNLLSDLRSMLGDRVRIANDADCFALSEAHGGAGDGAAAVFGVILGTGVGGGLVVHGRLLAGPSGLSGEWGHNVLPHPAGLLATDVEIPLGSRQCYCGQLNCIETYLSGPGLARTHHELWGVALDAQTVYRQAGYADGEHAELADAVIGTLPAPPGERGNGSVSTRQQARTTLTVYCQMLARSLAQLVNILDPTVIVLGGGLSQMTAIYQPLRIRLADLVFGGHGRTRIEAPAFGDASGVRGAAWLWSAD